MFFSIRNQVAMLCEIAPPKFWHFWAAKFQGKGPSKFLTESYKSRLPSNMWQSLVKIGKATSEIRWWKKKEDLNYSSKTEWPVAIMTAFGSILAHSFPLPQFYVRCLQCETAKAKFLAITFLELKLKVHYFPGISGAWKFSVLLYIFWIFQITDHHKWWKTKVEMSSSHLLLHRRPHCDDRSHCFVSILVKGMWQWDETKLWIDQK